MASNPDNPTIKLELTFDDAVVEVELEFHFSENAEDYLDVATFVSTAAAMLLA
ncbi:hypothetical protein SEA_DENNEBES_55 [Streptomyces phage Dennebes]|jgi:hypothetical protein|nr:hypothetical protein SEA_DENNEBES_55 [Streptomyces phage Dennebes]